MFSKLRENYNLSNVLLRIAFVLTFLFATWQQFLGTLAIMDFSALGVTLNDTAKLLVAILSSLILGSIIMFLLPFFVNIFLNAIRNVNIPRAEYRLIVYAFFVMGFFAVGLLNLINLFTPIFLVWGGVLFPFLVYVAGAIGFYQVTAKLYFNDVTQIYYFRGLIIAYVILGIMLGVIL